MDISCIKGAICLAYKGQCGFCPLYTPKAKIGPNRVIIDMPRLTIRDVGKGSIYKGNEISLCAAINRYRVCKQLPKKMIKAIEKIFSEYEEEIKNGIPKFLRRSIDEAYTDENDCK